MFPIILNPEFTRFLLVGSGELANKRLAQLHEANANVKIFTNTLPTKDEIKSAHIVYIVDLEEKQAEKIAKTCRKHGVLVNVEDVIPLCDFHTPSLVRRGDLLLSFSTNGKSPALAKRLRKYMSKKFGPQWQERLDILGKMRQEWRLQGLSIKQVSRKTDKYLDEQGWLDDDD